METWQVPLKITMPHPNPPYLFVLAGFGTWADFVGIRASLPYVAHLLIIPTRKQSTRVTDWKLNKLSKQFWHFWHFSGSDRFSIQPVFYYKKKQLYSLALSDHHLGTDKYSLNPADKPFPLHRSTLLRPKSSHWRLQNNKNQHTLIWLKPVCIQFHGQISLYHFNLKKKGHIMYRRYTK